MRQKSDKIIHVEFGDFASLDFFKQFEKYIIRNSNSLGMNEQEIKMILDYWEDPFLKSFEVSKQQPTIEEVISDIKKFFKVQKKKGLDISRLHLHPYGSFFMCYDTNKWNSGRDAIFKSAIALPKYCINGPSKTSLNAEHLEPEFLAGMYDIDPIPREIPHPYDPYGEEKTIKFSRDTLNYEFLIDKDIEC
jgi:ADP-dependent phosphofructokinase/glucokinase